MNFDKHYDAIVLGGGPAGLAAGIYLSRAKMKTLIISEGTVGGQMILKRSNLYPTNKNTVIINCKSIN